MGISLQREVAMLIKNAHIVDPVESLDEVYDLLVKDGKICKIEKNIDVDDELIFDANGLILAPSFFDPHTHFRDFGESDKETFESGAMAALRGGYTEIVAMANTVPPIDSKEMVEEAFKKVKDLPIDIYISSNVTKSMKGKELVNFEELLDMGVIGFTDDGFPLCDINIMREALKKSRDLKFIISLHEEDPEYIEHPGYDDTAPREAEVSIIKRDIDLLREVGGHLHVQHLTSKDGVQLIRDAKAEGLNITTEVNPNHLYFTKKDVDKYGTLLKVNPPLRTEEDRLALIDGLRDGTIDMIGTDHAPHTKENKEMGKFKSKSGITSLEIAFSMLNMKLIDEAGFSIMDLIRVLSTNPRALYNKTKAIKIGEPADFVLIDLNREYIYDYTLSKSKNTPLLGARLKGQIIMTVKDGNVRYNDINYKKGE